MAWALIRISRVPHQEVSQTLRPAERQDECGHSHVAPRRAGSMAGLRPQMACPGWTVDFRRPVAPAASAESRCSRRVALQPSESVRGLRARCHHPPGAERSPEGAVDDVVPRPGRSRTGRAVRPGSVADRTGPASQPLELVEQPVDRAAASRVSGARMRTDPAGGHHGGGAHAGS